MILIIINFSPSALSVLHSDFPPAKTAHALEKNTTKDFSPKKKFQGPLTLRGYCSETFGLWVDLPIPSNYLMDHEMLNKIDQFQELLKMHIFFFTLQHPSRLGLSLKGKECLRRYNS